MRYPTGLVPVLPLRNTVQFPGVSQLLSVGRPRSISAVRKAQEMGKNQDGSWILAVAQKTPNATSKDELTPEHLYDIGTLCRIESVRGNSEQGLQVFVHGVARVRYSQPQTIDGHWEVMIEPLADVHDAPEATLKALLESMKALGRDILKLIPANTDQIRDLIDGVEDLSFLTALVAANVDIGLPMRQEILAEPKLKERAMRLLQIMQEQKENLTIQQEIRSKLSQKMGEGHRQAILREQLKTIRAELGEGEEDLAEGEMREKIEAANMPEEAKKLALSEARRLEQISAQSPEHQIVRNYLEIMTELPWQKSSPEHDIDLENARKILDRDHYGIDKVKKRILQHLAVMKLKKTTKGTILLFVGPPGVGKTSLGESIAEALGRKFMRVSLGGVRDDAEIRGHRRTYVGAMPGRIVAGLRRAGENNPVMLFDEIDKMARGYGGDPASAMLEVLDPEQNKKFVDHFLDTGFDLSKVFFIATANSLDTIPAPLLDRMEVIELSGYSNDEKLNIAKQHLLPQELMEHGMSPEQVRFSDAALLRLISGYTREAGVRDLRRKIAEVCRGTGERVLGTKAGDIVLIEESHLDDILGPERFTHDVTPAAVAPGVVTGLAWTPVGGDILFIETTLMPGSGNLQMTGQLGDVMKESAHIALSLLRSRMSVISPEMDYKKFDVHVHIPAGSIPKDGPSAGVTMLTSLASAFSKQKVRPNLAMTGEITLRGAVTPVGGIKEKVVAAHRAGVREVILPRRNERDLREIPNEVQNDIKFHFVDHVNDVLKIALHLDKDFIEPFNETQTHPVMNAASSVSGSVPQA